jgi:hypothetical protein
VDKFVRLITLVFCFLAGLGAGMAVVSALEEYDLLALLFGNLSFIIVSGAFIWRSRTLVLSSAGSVLGAACTFIGTGIVLADLGTKLYFSVPIAGRILVQVFSLGYYPPGADAPFDLGSMLWALSMLALCGAALAFGGFLKFLRPLPEE